MIMVTFVIWLLEYGMLIGSQIDIPPTEDIHTVASLLKLYLRELPKPVIPYGLFDDAIKVTKCKYL